MRLKRLPQSGIVEGYLVKSDMVINIKYKKPYGIRYDCYYNNVKVDKKKGVRLPDSGTILLVERSPFLGHLWWLIVVLLLLIGLVGGLCEDWKNERKKQRTIAVDYENFLSDEISVEVSAKGRIVLLYGVEKFTVGGITEKENPLIVRRLKYARAITIAVPIIILVIIAAVLAVALL